jgi:dipeptidyl aminopeptidase/acylaminoacyl peptidase
LADRGFLCVTIDIPSHGAERRADEPEGLEGWNYRTSRNEDFVAESTRRLTSVLDFLLVRHLADPRRIAVCGTSRGGFLALHFAAKDKRIRCVAAFAPVTDLLMLREFHNQTDTPFAKSLALHNHVDDLAGKPIWIVIGDQDDRVGTDKAISFARQLTAASLKHKVESRGELHVLPESRGHTLPDRVSDDAAAWIVAEIK